MTDRYHEHWEQLGATDPYSGAAKDDFFALGEEEIDRLFERLKEREITPTLNRAVDFGCGPGRLSRALATRFAEVTAIDSASSMLAEARTANAAFPNIEFCQNTSASVALLDDKSVDFIYTSNVLRHMPDTNQMGYIREFNRALRPGGVLVFQTLSHGNLSTLEGWAHHLLGNSLINAARRLKPGAGITLEQHTLSRNSVHKLLQSLGLKIAFTERYDSTGKAFQNYRYYAEKPASP